MEIFGDIFSWLLVVFILPMSVAWVWVLYYMIKCWKVDSCVDRKCRYWEWCKHNHAERKKDEIEMRKQNLMRRHGSPEDNRNKETE